MTNRLIPVQNAWVKYILPSGQERTGRVEATIPKDDGIHVKVKWNDGQGSTLVPLEKLSNGFKINMDVKDVPISRTRTPFARVSS